MHCEVPHYAVVYNMLVLHFSEFHISS